MGYSQEVIDLALKVQEKYNVPASVTLGAYAYESGWGKSSLAKKNHNYFGITGKGTAGSTYGTTHTWAKYNNMEESFDAFGKLLSSNKYSKLTQNANSTYEYVHAYADTYAPPSDGNVSYADNLLKIISDYNLTQYDTVKFAESSPVTPLAGESSDNEQSWFSKKVSKFADDLIPKLALAITLIVIVIMGGYAMYKTFM